MTPPAAPTPNDPFHALRDELARRRDDWFYTESGSDLPIVTVGYSASFYFWGGHTQPVRDAVVACIEDFHASFGEHLRWCIPGEDPMQSFARKERPDPRKYMEGLDADDAMAWYESSSEAYEAVGDYAILALTARAWEQQGISDLTFHVPYALALEPGQRPALDALVRRFIERLKPYHARMGIGTQLPYEDFDWHKDEFDLAVQFTGLEVGVHSAPFFFAPYGLRSTDWITYVSDLLAERVGGRDALLDACLKKRVPAGVLGQGVVIETAPFFGAEGDAVPEVRLAANHLLRPLRWGGLLRMGTVNMNGALTLGDYFSDLWVRRFDAPGIWPPLLSGVIPDDVPLKPPKKKLVLRSGKVCEVAGRYAGKGHDDPQLVLMPGDVAPLSLRLDKHGKRMGVEPEDWLLLGTL